MTKSYFITSTGTGIGKTAITCSMARQLKNIAVIKPVISGWGDDSDTHKILHNLGLQATPDNINKISPWRFDAPLSPDIAAAKEGKELHFSEVVEFCKNAQGKNYLLIEGAGGVMTPLCKNKTNADLIAALQIPAILVVGTYLGTISHTLTALKTLESYNIKIERLIINQSEDCTGADDIMQSLKCFTNVDMVFMPRVSDGDFLNLNFKI